LSDYKVGASLQHAISHEPRISFFGSTGYLLARMTRSYRVLCGGIEDNLTLNNFSFINQIKFHVTSAVRRLPDKSSAADPLPTTILKQVVDLLSPFITELFNRSLATGRFLAGFSQAFITPIAKKPGLDGADASSYRPISNLSVLSKLLERLVARQLMEYMTSANLLPARQSGFRPGHSTETAVLQVLSDILLAIDRGDLAALILLQCLQMSFGIQDVALQWFSHTCWDGRSTYGAGIPGQLSSRLCVVCRVCTVHHVHCRLGLGD